MAGPGSPSYALRQWAGGPIPARARRPARGRRHRDDGQRGGPDARRRDRAGLRDLQGRRRIRAGSTGSTCSAGRPGSPRRGRPPLRQRRGRQPRHPVLLPRRAPAAGPGGDSLPEGAFVLGVDGHTALVLDLERPDGQRRRPRRRSRSGSRGRSMVFPSGTRDDDRGPGRGRAADAGRAAEATDDRLGRAPDASRGTAAGSGRRPPRGGGPPARRVADARRGVRRGPRASATPRAAVGGPARPRLGDRGPAAGAARTAPTSTAPGRRSGPCSSGSARRRRPASAIRARRSSRSSRPCSSSARGPGQARDWASADLIRDRLVAAGVEVRDDGDGSTWTLG